MACLPAGGLPLPAASAVMILDSLNLSLLCLNALIVARVHSEGFSSKCVATFERHHKEQGQEQGQGQGQGQEEAAIEESAMSVAHILSQPVACHSAKGNYPHCRFKDFKYLLDALFIATSIIRGNIEVSDHGRSLQGGGFFIIRHLIKFIIIKYTIVNS